MSVIPAARRNYALNPVPLSSAANWFAGFGNGAGATSLDTTAGDGPEGRTGFRRSTFTTAATLSNGAGHWVRFDGSRPVVPAGTPTYCSVWYRSSVALTVQVRLLARLSNANVGGEIVANTVDIPANTWVNLGGVIAPTGDYDATQIRIFALPGFEIPAGATLDMGSVLFADSAGSYFDGSFPATPDWTYSWDGPVNNSASTATPSPGLWVERMPDAGAPQVGVTVTGLDAVSPSVVSVQVSWDEGFTWHTVRGADRITVTGALFVRDHVPPLNVEARYRLVVHSGAVTPLRGEDRITIVSDRVWVQDPLDPRTAVAVQCSHDGDDVYLLADSVAAYSRRRPLDLVTPLGGRLPVASAGTRQAPSGIPLYLRAPMGDQGALAKAVRELFDSAGVVVFRGLPGELGLDAVLHAVDSVVTDAPVVGRILGMRTDFTLAVDQVAPPSLRISVVWWTYAQVAALTEGQTYADRVAQAAGATYLDVQRDPTLGDGA